MFGISAMLSTLEGMLEERKVRNAWLDSLPEATAKKIREEDAQKSKELLAHNRALEIARAGTPLNFWGNK